MAKLFYTIDEAAAKLRKSNDEVMRLADDGQLDVFRDRDRVMFKVAQVDLLAGDDADMAINLDDEPAPRNLGGSGSAVPLAADSGELAMSDEPEHQDIRLASDHGSGFGLESPKEQSGISVFEVDEVGDADAAAQTQVTEAVSAGFSVGDSGSSGSGMMDLTREVEDSQFGGGLASESAFGGVGAAVGAGAAAGAALFESSGADADNEPAPSMLMAAAEPIAPMWSGATAGLALGSVLVTAGAVAAVMSGMMGSFSQTFSFVPDMGLPMVAGIALGVVALLGIIGAFIGKMAG